MTRKSLSGVVHDGPIGDDQDCVSLLQEVMYSGRLTTTRGVDQTALSDLRLHRGRHGLLKS